jgi:hypothetical protein
VRAERVRRRFVPAGRGVDVEEPLQRGVVVAAAAAGAQPTRPEAVLQQGDPVTALQVVLGDAGGGPYGGVQY